MTVLLIVLAIIAAPVIWDAINPEGPAADVPWVDDDGES